MAIIHVSHHSQQWLFRYDSSLIIDNYYCNHSYSHFTKHSDWSLTITDHEPRLVTQWIEIVRSYVIISRHHWRTNLAANGQPPAPRAHSPGNCSSPVGHEPVHMGILPGSVGVGDCQGWGLPFCRNWGILLQMIHAWWWSTYPDLSIVDDWLMVKAVNRCWSSWTCTYTCIEIHTVTMLTRYRRTWSAVIHCSELSFVVFSDYH